MESEGLREQRVGACKGDRNVTTDDDRPGRRTSLAVERTYLAWWRTGLTAYAVALATARVVPDLSKAKVQWPYTLLGIGFAIFGTACILVGEQRRRYGESHDASPIFALGLTAGGLLLGVGMVLVLAIEP
jgi:putative membrane protein